MEVLSPPPQGCCDLTRGQFAWPDDSSSGMGVTEDQANQVSERKGGEGIGECPKTFGIDFWKGR